MPEAILPAELFLPAALRHRPLLALARSVGVPHLQFQWE
jgi:hypothetical protein